MIFQAQLLKWKPRETLVCRCMNKLNVHSEKVEEFTVEVLGDMAGQW